jgi:two-component system response regulator HydG
MKGRVMVVEDDPEMGQLLQDRLSRRGFEVRADVPPESALETLAAMRAGAFDFLPKPFEVDELAFRLDRALAHRRLTAEVRRLRAEARPGVEEPIGDSPPMQRLRDLIARLAASDAPALVTGETGTGKELVARALHRHGSHPDGPFVAINCAALPEPLLESELFGHERGAFTDARAARTGLVLQAHGGTLFLDEIAELPLALQPKLLRVLQERRVRPLGAALEVPCDARVVAATNRDLETAVEEGRFREDLFFRLDVLRVEVPPLRARGNDVLLLAYPWPGNVRELQNAIERAIALARHDQILVEDLPERIRAYGRAHVLVVGEDPSELVPLEVVEQRYIARVLEAVGGNKTLAARILGLDRKTLYRKLDRLPRRGP